MGCLLYGIRYGFGLGIGIGIHIGIHASMTFTRANPKLPPIPIQLLRGEVFPFPS